MEPALQLLQHIATVRQVKVLGDNINRLCAREPQVAALQTQMPPREIQAHTPESRYPCQALEHDWSIGFNNAVHLAGHAQPLSQEDALVTYLVLQQASSSARVTCCTTLRQLIWFFGYFAQGAMCQSMEEIELCSKLGALWQSVYGVSDTVTPLEQLYSSSFAQVGHNGRAEEDCRLWSVGSAKIPVGQRGRLILPCSKLQIQPAWFG